MLESIDTVPVWEESDGTLTYGLEPRDPHPPVVGWANVATIELDGCKYQILLTMDED